MPFGLRDFSRVFRSSRTSVAVAVLTLALTMGVGTAIFALLDAVVLTPPPFVEPESLVLVGEVPAGTTAATPYPVSWTTFQRWREYRRAVTQVEAFDSTNMTLTGRGPAERVSGTAVTTGFFSLLGVSTVLGRTWSEEQSDSDVAVVSEGFWREKLEMDAALGRPIVLGGRSFTVIGVLPPQFEFGLNPSDVWVPLRRLPRVRVLARLAPGTSAAEASRVLDEVSSQATPPAKAFARPVTAVIAGSAAAIVPLMLVAAAVAVSLTVINLTGLLGVRAIERHREFAIRRALGARTIEIVKQVVVEAHVIVAAGAAGGILVALWVTPWVGRLGRIPATVISVSWKAMAALGIIAWACAWLCGLAVAARGYRVSGSELLSRATSPGPRERSLRSAMVCIEVMLAFVLLASLTLVGRSLQRTLAIDPGFDAAGVMTAGVSLPRERYPDAPRVAAFYRSVGAVLSDRWGSGNVALIDELPLDGDAGRSFVGPQREEAEREAVLRVAGPGYFEVMRIPIIEGRGLEDRDDASSAMRVVVSQSLARALFGASRPAGRSLWVAALGRMAEVVGVVGDVKHRALDERTLPTLYVSAWQAPSPTSRFVIRSSRGALDTVSTLRAEVARFDPELPVYGVRPMASLVESSPGMPARRVMTACFSAFAALALVVAGIGLFGVVAHDLASRRFELALRVALGADPSRLQRSIAGHAAKVIVTGVIPGLLLSAGASRLLRSALADIDTTDPLAFAAVAAVLLLVAALAIAGPVRRVARTTPALRFRGE